MAGARVPGAPTLPEWDPTSLAFVMQRWANELYGDAPASVVPEGAHPEWGMRAQPPAPSLVSAATATQPAAGIDPTLSSVGAQQPTAGVPASASPESGT